MPKDSIYVPVQVGSNEENFKGFHRDNTGENISSKNKNYCELTAQYWGWKNRNVDVKGLVHYRRFFSNGKTNFFKSKQAKFNDIMNRETLKDLITKHEMILPRKRNYYIETSWSHYKHAHHIEGLEAARAVLVEQYPEYVSVFDEVVNRKEVHMFNMLVARAPIFDEYTTWLFSVLTEVEKRVDISDYSDYEKRILGFVSEILVDVWVEKNKIDYVELPVMFMEKQHWMKKIAAFLFRKFGGKKLEN
ncbi:capsular biosynthesis protein [Liquorilactobacillus capillatus DSM 19910]|uniref:Capsular biosynthesis protein n=2 Tax=Liquorilactobacillus capillatus TaxID=480931 RepID=A0A0R1M2H8_9LACO|nr:capsular biosynthesis protein [Liquorilactobacillus capillatus DSM 19910]